MATYITIGCVVTISNILIGVIVGRKLPSPEGLLDGIVLLIIWLVMVVIWPYQYVLKIRGYLEHGRGKGPD